jgi:hypothetical protein
MYYWFQRDHDFFPCFTWGKWKIGFHSSNRIGTTYWTEYDNLSTGMAMPGFGLYVR